MLAGVVGNLKLNFMEKEKKLNAYECYKLKKEKALSDQKYKELLKNNKIIIKKK